MTPQHRPSTEEREVRSDHQDLSPEANRLLTEELREAIGSDTVQVPAGTPRRGTDRPQAGSPLAATLASNRPLLIITLVAAVAVGAAVSLATGNWWAVVAMVAVHAVGTLVVATAALQLTTQTEHASPEVTEQDRVGPAAHGSLRRLLPIYVAIVVAVVVFMILMGVIVGAL